MLTSGFKNAPISQLLLVYIVTASILASLTDTKYYFHIYISPHLFPWRQVWRLFTWQLVYTNSTELLFAALTLYNLRTIERLWGTRKFLSFILLLYPWTSILPPLVLALVIRPLTLGHLNYLPAGPTPLLFAILAQWYAAIPSTYVYKLGTTYNSSQWSSGGAAASGEANGSTSGSNAAQNTAQAWPSTSLTITLSSKTSSYLLPLQLALSQFPHMLLPAAVGWALGHAYRNEMLPGTGWRVPGWVMGARRSGAQVDALRRRLESEAQGESTGVDGSGQVRARGRRTLGGLLGEQFWGGGR